MKEAAEKTKEEDSIIHEEYDKIMTRSDYQQSKRKWAWIILLILILAGAAAFWYLHQENDTRRLPVSTEEGISASIVDSAPETIPDYSEDDTIELNDGQPCFTSTDLNSVVGETYSSLDQLGRCGTAAAMLDRTMRPTEERGQIGDVRPTGWVQNKYPGIIKSEPPYLYNRCHLIAYAMTGQNANKRNLITGTRYLNASTMLKYEEQILRYLDSSDNHVLYRVSPYFKGSELVARGIELEAYSVEDNGKGICFHVFLYNIQPGIEIDYQTGESWI